MTQSAASGGEVHEEKPRLGELLVAMGALTDEQLREVLARQRETGLPLGRMLVESGHVMAHTVAMALADQHGGLLRTEYGFATGHGEAVPVKRIDVEEAVPQPEPAPILRLADDPEPSADSPELERVRAELATANAAVEQLRADHATILTAAEDLRAAALAERAKREAAEAAAAAAGQAPPVDDTELRELRATVERLSGELAAATSERAEVEAHVASLTTDHAAVDQLRSSLAAANATIDQLRIEVAAAAQAPSANDDALRAELAQARAEADELRSRLASAQQSHVQEFDGDVHAIFFRVADGYRLAELPGPPPAPGDVVVLYGTEYEVLRVAAPPVPGASSVCAFLEPR